MTLLLPQVFTPPLTEDFESDGYALIKVVEALRPGFKFHEWQKWVLIHLLERYPSDWPVERLRGQLRYKEACISVGRQNGKSEVATAMALYGLIMHSQHPEVFSIAALKDTARITFDRMVNVVNSSPTLQSRFKATAHHGIKSINKKRPAFYKVIAGKEDTLNGHPTTLTLYDELHIAKPEAYQQIVVGGSAISESMVVGITTAGDSNSDLLKRLYLTGEEAKNERFFFAKWEADKELDIYDRQAWLMANPSMFEGKVDVDEQIMLARSTPEHQIRRYRLNQFVSADNPWMPLSLWTSLQTGYASERKNIVYSINVSKNWNYASIVATQKQGDKTYSELVARLNNTSIDALEKVVYELKTKGGSSLFVTEGHMLRELSNRMKKRGWNTLHITPAEMSAVSMTAYAMIANNKVIHANDTYVKMQFPFTVAKQTADGHAIDRSKSNGDIDALLATVTGLYGCETFKKKESLPFVLSG